MLQAFGLGKMDLRNLRYDIFGKKTKNTHSDEETVNFSTSLMGYVAQVGSMDHCLQSALHPQQGIVIFLEPLPIRS